MPRSLRKVGDSPADDLIKRTFESGSIAQVREALMTLSTNDRLDEIRDAHPDLAAFLDRHDDPPCWLDRDKIKIAESVFHRYGMVIFTVLGCASLHECYANEDIAPVLMATGRFDDDVPRRLLETSAMVLAVMDKGGLLSEEGRGVAYIQRVRLLHAMIRHLVRHARDTQETSEDPATGPSSVPSQRMVKGLESMARRRGGERAVEVPINQEALALTLQTFCIVVVDGMETLGVRLTTEEREAFVHHWSVVGHFLGIERELLPDSSEEARELFRTLKKKCIDGSRTGVPLSAALIESLRGEFPFFAKRVPLMITHELVDKKTRELLGIPRKGWFFRSIQKAVLRVLRVVNGFRAHLNQKDPILIEFSSRFLMRILEKRVALPAGERRRLFELPERLRQDWGVDSPDDDQREEPPRE